MTSPLYNICLKCGRTGHCSAACKEPPILQRIADAARHLFWRHRWEHPANGNPYRRTCRVCGEHQEWDNGVVFETPREAYRWIVWNPGDHSKHYASCKEPTR